MRRSERPEEKTSMAAAKQALERGYQAIPIRDGGKRPYGSSWTHTHWDSPEIVEEAFRRFADEGATGIGLLLGEPSGGLVDVDLDHPKALRLQIHFLPPSAMATGRAGRPRSHRWYRVEENLPPTRQYRMPDKSMIIELRSTHAQTVIPPTIHPSGESYRWEGQPWGGSVGPAVVDGKKLATQVALLGMGAVLMENWPGKGGRHEAYLALAGGLLRFGDGIHPYWEKNLPVLIEALADATHDEDGPAVRKAEVMGSTITRLREGGKATGFTRLAEMIGAEHAELARRWARDVASLSGWQGTPIRRLAEPGAVMPPRDDDDENDGALVSTLPPEDRNPMEERISSWAAVDLEPYLSGEVVMPEPDVLVREDGQGLMYPGRVNSLFGLSESAKSWIALWACMQEMARGGRAVFIDLEDGPEGTISRMQQMGMGNDDITNQFRYVHPEGPLADMQRYRYGASPSEDGTASSAVFRALLDSFDPTIIVADGMTVLYGLHGHDTNEATATEVITGWLKSMARNGHTTVIVIDHTGKGGGAGSSPIGAHHKVAMVQGTALRVDVVDRPMPGKVGMIRLVVFKDRPGAVRAASGPGQEQVAGTVVIDSSVKGITRMKIVPPDPDEVVVGASDGMERRLAELAESDALRGTMLAMFEGDLDKYLTTGDVCDETKRDGKAVRAEWETLVNTDVVVAEGKNRWARFRLKPPLL